MGSSPSQSPLDPEENVRGESALAKAVVGKAVEGDINPNLVKSVRVSGVDKLPTPCTSIINYETSIVIYRCTMHADYNVTLPKGVPAFEGWFSLDRAAYIKQTGQTCDSVR